MNARRRVGLLGSLALVLILPAPAAWAVRAANPNLVLPDYDARLDPSQREAAALALRQGTRKPEDVVAGAPVEPGATRLAAVAALESEAGTRVTVRWDDVTGSPQMLSPRRGFLSGPDSRDPETIARDFVVAHRGLFLLSEDAARGLSASSVVPLSSGAAMVTFAQRIEGLDVLHGHLGVGVTKDGRVTHVAGGSVTGAGQLVSRTPRHVPAEAIAALMDVAGLVPTGPIAPKQALEEGQRFVVPGSRDPHVDVRLVVVPTAHGPHLAWVSAVSLAGSPAAYDVAVDDASLLALRRCSRTRFLDTRGRVFANNPDVSPHVIERFVDSSDYRFDESPAGWAAADLTEGNNTVVRDDIANDDDATLGRQAQATPPGPYLAFDFPYTADPASDLDASLTNLFRNINVSHDHFYRLGFDERSGNFQAGNFGRGGLGFDPVIGDCQDGGGTDNANFQTPPDGAPGRMQMYLWSGGTKDGSLDMGVVMHEYVHGVSTRIVGGPDHADCLFGLQGGSMGEAWSDYFAASFLDDPVIGAYVGGDPDVGIRMYALDDNPATGKDYRNFCTYREGIPDCPPLFCEVHANGEMWAGFLWLVREQYVARYGNPEGARRADQLIMDGMKLTPCSPSMLDARDAIILADRLATGGVHECLIKTAAANRWMGYSARPNGGPNGRPVGANDQWPECLTLGLIRFTREGLEQGATAARYSCEDLITVEVTDGNGGSVTSVLVGSSGGDSETVTLQPTTEPGIFTGSVQATTAASSPDDGALTVADGDVLTTNYPDPDATAPTTTTADVNCTPRLALERHFVRNGSCDTDEVAGYPELPGFIDRGEAADLVLEVRNLMSVPVTGTVSVTTDRPDLLTILPSATPFGLALPGAVGTSPATTLLTVKVVGSDTIDPLDPANDTANIFLDTTLLGFVPGPASSLALQLGRDYVLETGAPFSEDMELESAPVGPRFSTGTTTSGANQWSIITCNVNGGAQAYKNGETDCAGNYDDTQGDPWLATPAYTLADSATAAARITRVSFSHDVDLGAAGIPMFGVPPLFDAEAVVVLATNDPTVANFSEPFGLLDEAIAIYANLSFLGLDSNTTGYVPQVIDVNPLQLSGVDLRLPTYLAWYFIADFTPPQCPSLPFPLSAAGEGYHLDDLTMEWERVQVVPSPSSCTAPAVVYALPRIVSPDPATGCAGTAVQLDASASEAIGCGTPASLEFRFVDAGAPVACFDDAAATTPRVQDVDGWGASPTCFAFPAQDTRYVVEARCASDPTVTDARTVTMRVIDGLAVIGGSGLAFCAGSGDTIVVDASASSLVGCPDAAEYRYVDSLGAPVDCDGDTVPDDFRADPTCIVGPSDTDLAVSVELRCSTFPGCAFTGSLTIPAISVTAAAGPATTPPGGVYCPDSAVTVTGAASAVAGCAEGAVQYRWTDPLLTFDTGWTLDPEATYTLATDTTLTVEVRCNLNVNCTSTDTVDLVTRKGTFSYGSTATPDDCPGTVITIAGTPRNVTCAAPAVVELRFLFDADRAAGPNPPAPITCIARAQDVDGWGTATTCDTPQVAGGGDYIIEMRCSEDPACVIETGQRTYQPRSGTPVGTTFGDLFTRKSGAGCPSGGDVRLTWPSSDYLPSTYVATRCEEPTFGGSITGYPAPVVVSVDVAAWTDAGAACDGGGGYRGPGGTGLPVQVYFYQYHLRDSCTNQPLPDP